MTFRNGEAEAGSRRDVKRKHKPDEVHEVSRGQPVGVIHAEYPTGDMIGMVGRNSIGRIGGRARCKIGFAEFPRPKSTMAFYAS